LVTKNILAFVHDAYPKETWISFYLREADIQESEKPMAGDVMVRKHVGRTERTGSN